jgi:NADH-quinone oxidoreductase subunit M
MRSWFYSFACDMVLMITIAVIVSIVSEYLDFVANVNKFTAFIVKSIEAVASAITSTYTNYTTAVSTKVTNIYDVYTTYATAISRQSYIDSILLIEVCTKINFTLLSLAVLASSILMYNSWIRSEDNTYYKFSFILPFVFFVSLFIQLYIIYLFITMQPFTWTSTNLSKSISYTLIWIPFNSNLTIDLFGSTLILLAYIIGFLSMLNFYDRTYWLSYRHSLLFNLFILVVIIFVSCDDVYIFFIFYELLLLPSFLLVYFSSPNKKGIQASLYFLIWTQLGSLLVYLAVNYIVTLVGSSSAVDIKNYKFSKDDIWILKILLFVGFGFKIPIYPLHYWLTKTHVEAIGSFSMYLSGFLVKTALFGFYKFSLILNSSEINIICVCIALIGVVDASFKLWNQVDLKKLVAFCTIQEMNLIVICFLYGFTNVAFIGILFCIMHAILSSLMFFLVDCIQRRYQSRQTVEVVGIIHTTPNLGLSLIAMVLLFLAVPGTLKFSCEFMLFCFMTDVSYPLSFILIIAASSIAPISFVRVWYGSIFGSPSKKHQINNDLTHKEILVISLCILLLIFLSSISYNFF